MVFNGDYLTGDKMTDLTVANTLIRKNENGLYCLNDLHKAAGGLSKNKPQYFMMNNRTKDLITVCSDDGIPSSVVIKGGDNQGTYVCKELVYAYAMWISAEFYHHVIKTYDAVVTGQMAMSQADEKMLRLTEIDPNCLKAIIGSRNNSETRQGYKGLVDGGYLVDKGKWVWKHNYVPTEIGLECVKAVRYGILRFKPEYHAVLMTVTRDYTENLISDNRDLFLEA